jgi:hypothetical protein
VAKPGTKPWNSGKGKGWETANGYIQISQEHRHVLLHRLLFEQYLGRPLLSCEHIHHRDGDKCNNALENLQLIDPGAHATLTNSNREYKRGYVLSITPEERKARAERMRITHAKYPHIRAGLKKGTVRGVVAQTVLVKEAFNG